MATVSSNTALDSYGAFCYTAAKSTTRIRGTTIQMPTLGRSTGSLGGIEVRETAAAKRKTSILVSRRLALAAGLLTLCGCSTMAVRQRDWTPTTYSEEWKIRTIPSGCKIYINDEYNGEANDDSPVVTTVNGGAVMVSSVLDHNEKFTPKRQGSWTIKACKEGYETATRVVVCGDGVLQTTFENERANIKRWWGANPWAFAPPIIMGKRSVLLELRPIGLAQNANIPPVANVVGHGTAGGRMVDDAARAEYDQALAAYKQAMERRNFSRLGANATNVASQLPDANWNPKFSGLMSLTQQYSLDDSDKEVEVARQRIERAEARINHSEWPQ